MALQNLQSIAFVTLTDVQVEQLTRCTMTALRTFKDGETLIHVGQRDFAVYVVKSGAIAVIDSTGDTPQVLTVHGPGGFTGDVSHLTGTPAVVSAVAQGDCQAYEIPRPALKQILNQCPTISDIILQAFIARRQMMHQSPDFTGLRVIGSRYSPDTFRVRDFLARNRVLYTWIDIESDPQFDILLKGFGVTEADTPVVACGRMLLLRNPANRELAEAVGIRQPLQQELYDMVVVGAGPAGLAASVYGASECLRTVMLETTAPGGQAGSSMRIENYLGFPTGITGRDLTDRAILQANKFGAQISVPSQVSRLEFSDGYPVVHLESGETVSTKCVLIATGAQYRRLDVAQVEQFEGRGVYYAASLAEAQLCSGQDVLVVGGGNSAGQAAVFLAGQARRVLVLIRGDDLRKSMSSYLVQRIEHTANIELHCTSTILRMEGDGHLSAVHLVNHSTGQETCIATPGVFSFIGANPRTAWLPPEIERDSKCFVRTGAALAASPHWQLQRSPYLLETSHPGVFAAGDVRAGSVKRVASAVGEGSMAVQFVHEYLKGQ